MDKKTANNQRLITGFKGILTSIPNGKSYYKSIPRKTKDLPRLSDEEVEAIYLNENGESSNINYYNYKKEDIDFRIEGLNPLPVSTPSLEDIDDLEIFGIDGSNQRIDNPSFSLILIRATIVNFRYTSNLIKPYFYTIDKNCAAVTQVDGNIFNRSLKSHVNDVLYSKTKNQDKNKKVSILEPLKNQDNGRPYLLGYNHKAGEKSPSAHALGWAVKFMNALELLCLTEVPLKKKFVCIKDGPLFSASSTKKDTAVGLKPLDKWENGVLVAVSKRIADSRLFIDLFSQFPDLVEAYFPKQNVDVETIKSLGTDSLILPRILNPGFRTPLIKAIPYNRIGYVKDDKGKESYNFPLVCYYMRKAEPHNIIRIEVPIGAYKKDKERVEHALRIVAWQFEIGIKAPLVQLAADERCQLSHEIDLLKMQVQNELSYKGLSLMQYY